MNDYYTTREGFDLPKPLLLPDATSFSEVLIAEKPWDFATMNHRNGLAQADTPVDITRPGFERRVSRFCAVRNLAGPHLMVTPTDPVLELIYPDGRGGVNQFDTFAFFDIVSFEAIYHSSNHRVLITASANNILASRWLAYVSPESVPFTTINTNEQESAS